jgi:flagellar protein FlaJ
MGLTNFLPLGVAVFLFGALASTPYSTILDRVVGRLSMGIFGGWVGQFGRRKGPRRATLRAAHVPTTYREYAARTLFYSLAVALGAGVAGMYVVWGVLLFLVVPEERLRESLPDGLEFLSSVVGMSKITVGELFAVMIVGTLTIGAVAGLVTYLLRWYLPASIAGEREQQIDISMPMTVSFVYALSRSGMSFPEVMRILAENRHVYGHAADEVGVAVREMDVFGRDVITTVQTMARRSPSDSFREFSENLASVLQTGGSLSEFLHRQYEEFREEAAAQQEQLLTRIETFAEVYVTGGVVLSLFLITILTVAGIVGVGSFDTLLLLRVIIYLGIPLGNLAFIIVLSTIVDNLSPADPTEEDVSVDLGPGEVRRTSHLAEERAMGTDADADARTATDGGVSVDVASVRNRARLRAYKRVREVRRRLGSPVETIIRRPTRLLWVTFPVAIFLLGIRLPFYLFDGLLTVTEFDDLVIQSTLFVFGTFAVAYEVHRRRIDAIEAVVPDLLDRLSSLNDAGMSFVESLRRVRDTDLGPLNEELDTVWADVRWGADVETALKRFEARIRTQTISRVVTLTTEALNASGNIGTVLRIAAEQAKADRRLERKRRQEMVTYLVVVYVAFFVFLFIVAVLNQVLIPSLPEASAVPTDTATGATPVPVIGNLGDVDEAAYSVLYLHTAVIQGVFSGLVAGQLSTGDIRAGAKHVTVMVALGYSAFLFFI